MNIIPILDCLLHVYAFVAGILLLAVSCDCLIDLLGLRN